MLTSAGPIVVQQSPSPRMHPIFNLTACWPTTRWPRAARRSHRWRARTGAVAGINADYFDIGRTNRPTNIVVRDGALMRSPRKRYALVIPRSGPPQNLETGLVGSVQLADRSVALDALNAEPGRGTTLLTPAFGAVAPCK